jgi:hypothetical protein
MRLNTILLFFSFLTLGINAQENQNTFDLNVALNCRMHLSTAAKNGTNHFTLGISVGTAIRRDKIPAALLLQLGINLYSKGLGSNILDNYRDPDAPAISREYRRKFEMDIVSTALLNLEFGNDIPSGDRMLFPFVFFNQMTAYSLQPIRYYNVFYGTSFIFNTSHRNQQVGSLGFNSPQVSLSYSNDGEIGKFVGDYNDRFWTGSGYLRIKPYKRNRSNPDINLLSFEYYYDRFTYDVQSGYKLANILLIPNADDVSFYNLLFNNSTTTFRINYGIYSLGYSIYGKSKIDIQNLIHKTLGYPLHLTYAQPEHMISFGFTPTIK